MSNLPENTFNNEVQRQSAFLEKSCQKFFKSEGYTTIPLDKIGPSGGSDFLFTKGTSRIICECHYVATAGIDKTTGNRVTTHLPSGPSQIEVTSAKRDLLQEIEKKTAQYRKLKKHDYLLTYHPQYRNFPFVIFLGFDQLADFFRYIRPEDLRPFPELSAVMRRFDYNNVGSGFTDEAIKALRKKGVRLTEQLYGVKIVLNPYCLNPLRPKKCLTNYKLQTHQAN